MKKNQIVKFAEPIDEDEPNERFVVLEDREDRVLVEAASGFELWNVKPTYVYPARDLVKAD